MTPPLPAADLALIAKHVSWSIETKGSVVLSPSDATRLIEAVRTLTAREAALRYLLTLTPSGHVGPDRIPWFTHCGISHAEGAECIVCAALSEPREER